VPAGLTDAADCGHRETAGLDARRGSQPLRGDTEPRINDLLRGRVSRFPLDALVNISTALAAACESILRPPVYDPAAARVAGSPGLRSPAYLCWCQ
jgi:hypothetical protein